MVKKIVLVIIILLGCILRFYKLGENPPSLYWDEVALGYNAYSIAQTARDEEGVFLPIQYFRSFGDFKPPVYIYAAVPMIKFFGLNEWTTRFPSAFFGSLSLLLTYCITKQLLSRKESNDHLLQAYLPLLAAFLLAVSPWHTQLSRVAFEANVALFLVLLGLYAFLRFISATQRPFLWILLSITSWILTLYTFNSNRVFTPLLAVTAILFFSKEIIRNNRIKPLVIAALIGVAMILPLVPHLISKEGQLRYQEVNIFSDSKIVELSNERTERMGNTIVAKLINNRRILYAQSWLDGYFRHFSAKFLFISGDNNPRFSLQDVGEMYIFELPFLLIGLYAFIISRDKKYYFILVWMLLAPVPSAFARETPHALRTLNILPTLQILTAYGFLQLAHNCNQHRKRVFLIPTLSITSVLLVTLSVYYYLHNYYVHYPRYASQEWQYGYKQMVQKVSQLQSQYDRIVVTEAYGRAYINMLFYTQYPPSLFQKQRIASIDKTGFGFVEVHGFDKYQFKGVQWKQEIADQSADERVLLVGTPAELTEGKYTKAVIRDMKNVPLYIINETPKGIDSLIELGILDKNGDPILVRPE